MKNKYCILFLSLAVCDLRANPIRLKFLSEVMVDSTHWLIEFRNLFSNFSISLDPYSLVSKSSQTAFKKGLFINDGYLVVSQADLESDFHIDPTGDTLEVVEGGTLALDRFILGAVRADQSWCILNDWSSYLDNTPTIGQPNDTLNAMGQIRGSVTDSVGNPIEDIEAYWGYGTMWRDNTLAVDSSGHFSIRVLATSVTFTFQKEGYEFLRAYASAYPESTVTVNFILKSKPPNSVADRFDDELHAYSLSNNYPNPFNASTIFSYHIAHDDFVEVNLYDLSGRLVENLFSGFQAKGTYRLMWDAFAAPSGIYVYRLRTSRVTMSKKCLVLR